jgi:hypothetical protein
MKNMEQPVMLRMLVFERHSRVDMICIDTDVAVSAPTLDAAKMEMKDALASYLQSFSPEDFERMKFLRPAPFHYRFAWKLGIIMLRGLRLIENMRSLLANYDPHDHTLRFAR